MALLSKIHCPSCDHEKCVSGNIGRNDIDDSYPSKFYPAGTGDGGIRPRAKLKKGKKLFCCLKCGLVWGWTDPSKVFVIMEKHARVDGKFPPIETFVTNLPQPVCVGCGYSHCVPGGLIPEFGHLTKSTFHPDGIKYWYGNSGALLRQGNVMFCCLKCGLVWAFTEAKIVIDILEKLGVSRGDVPIRASYAAHVGKWVLFLLISGAITIWLASFSHH